MLNQISLLFVSLALSSCNLIFSLNVDWSTRERLEENYRGKFQTFYQGEKLPPKILESEFLDRDTLGETSLLNFSDNSEAISSLTFL